jgi:hypothetical protein
MAESTRPRIVIVGGGPAGRAAAALLPDATLVARPEATAWHVEAGTIWTCSEAAVAPVGFDVLLLAAPVPQLALALGCRMRGWQPEIDATGCTSVPGVFAAGSLIGAASAEEAARQGRIAAQAILGAAREGDIVPQLAQAAPQGDVLCSCLGVTAAEVAASGLTDPAAIADLFGLRAGACRMARCGPLLGDPVLLFPAAPVPLAALAARTVAMPSPRPRQSDPLLAERGA